MVKLNILKIQLNYLKVNIEILEIYFKIDKNYNKNNKTYENIKPIKPIKHKNLGNQAVNTENTPHVKLCSQMIVKQSVQTGDFHRGVPGYLIVPQIAAITDENGFG